MDLASSRHHQPASGLLPAAVVAKTKDQNCLGLKTVTKYFAQNLEFAEHRPIFSNLPPKTQNVTTYIKKTCTATHDKSSLIKCCDTRGPIYGLAVDQVGACVGQVHPD